MMNVNKTNNLGFEAWEKKEKKVNPSELLVQTVTPDLVEQLRKAPTPDGEFVLRERINLEGFGQNKGYLFEALGDVQNGINKPEDAATSYGEAYKCYVLPKYTQDGHDKGMVVSQKYKAITGQFPTY